MSRGRAVGSSKVERHLLRPRMGARAGVLPLLLLLGQCGQAERNFSATGSAGMGAEVDGGQNGQPPPALIEAGGTCAEAGLRICAGASQKRRLVCVNGL